MIDECRRLVDSGVVEITLLGQTVNHYRYTHGVAVGVEGRELPQVGPGAAAFCHANAWRWARSWSAASRPTRIPTMPAGTPTPTR